MMNVPGHDLKDARTGYTQKRYMLLKKMVPRKQTGVRNFVDVIEILFTYLPLFPLIWNECMAELTQQDKQAILYDALPHYYIKKIKEVNKTPFEMPLEEILSYALNIEETAVNPRHNDEVN
jgi:hypothetical protein